MTALPSPFGDERLDADLASILNLGDEHDRKELVTPARTPLGSKSLRLSRRASVTIAVSLGFALLAPSVMLLLDRIPGKPPGAEITRIPNRLAFRRVAETAGIPDAKEPNVTKPIDEERTVVATHGSGDRMQRTFTSNADYTSRRPRHNATSAKSLAFNTARRPADTSDPVIEPVRFPTLLASNENSLSSTIARPSTEPENASDPRILESIDPSPQLKKARRASIDAIRFLRRQ
jgi:hypothetical protein